MASLHAPRNPYHQSSHRPGPEITMQEQEPLDAMEVYFQCITTCSLEDGECVTRCVEELRESV
jgi:hypothetical protein